MEQLSVDARVYLMDLGQFVIRFDAQTNLRRARTEFGAPESLGGSDNLDKRRTLGRAK
jgi:hypothetical protein